MSSPIAPGSVPETSHPQTPDTERTAARHRLERKRKFTGDLVAYVVINAFLVVIWAVGDRGYFWPGWVLGGWGVLLLLDAWALYFRRPITDADVERELQRQH